MKLKLTSEVPDLSRMYALDRSEDSEPQRTAISGECSCDVAIKGFLLDVANQG